MIPAWRIKRSKARYRRLSDKRGLLAWIVNWQWCLVLAAMLAACAAQTPPPVPAVVVQRVEVPVPVKCNPDLGPEPEYITDMQFAGATDIFVAVILYKRDRLLRIARDAEKTAALRSCSGG